jgi:hypothetical protein
MRHVNQPNIAKCKEDERKRRLDGVGWGWIGGSRGAGMIRFAESEAESAVGRISVYWM